jgi:hypothetical protein
MGSYMEIFEARVLGENLYLHQRFTPCLLKLSHKQDTILKIGDFSTNNYDFPPKPLLQILPCKNPSKIMIITSHMQKIIQIHPCLLSYRIKKKVWRRQTDGGYFYIPHRYRGEIKIYIIKYGGSRDCMVVGFITTYAISAHHH